MALRAGLDAATIKAGFQAHQLAEEGDGGLRVGRVVRGGQVAGQPRARIREQRLLHERDRRDRALDVQHHRSRQRRGAARVSQLCLLCGGRAICAASRHVNYYASEAGLFGLHCLWPAIIRPSV